MSDRVVRTTTQKLGDYRQVPRGEKAEKVMQAMQAANSKIPLFRTP
jgi:hypothetical protein